MQTLINDFSKQLRDAVVIAKNSSLHPVQQKISNILIAGMGGSGICGTMVSEIVHRDCKVPVHVLKDYFLPGFINENSLVIICSYSGDTEEMLSVYAEAEMRKAKIVCISSGGKLKEISSGKKIDHVLIPDGLPPRAAIGFSLAQILYIFHFYGFIFNSFCQEIEQASRLIEREQKNIQSSARELARKLKDKITVIYGSSGMESVALRFRQQINENSKALCWHHVFPELNHNEIQGWKVNNENLSVVIFRNDNDYSRTSHRIDFTKTVLTRYNTDVHEIYSKGNSQIERMLYLIHWGDWVSYYLAEFKGMDSMDITVIQKLKAELEKI